MTTPDEAPRRVLIAGYDPPSRQVMVSIGKHDSMVRLDKSALVESYAIIYMEPDEFRRWLASMTEWYDAEVAPTLRR